MQTNVGNAKNVKQMRKMQKECDKCEKCENQKLGGGRARRKRRGLRFLAGRVLAGDEDLPHDGGGVD